MSKIKKFTKFFNKISKRRKPSVIRSLLPLSKLPGMISFAGGLPNPKGFPFGSISFTLDGQKKNISLTSEQLNTALQYSNTNGVPEFLQWVMDHQKRVHKPPLEDKEWTCLVSNGSQDSLSRTFEMLIDEGDYILVENPTYPGALSSLNPLKPKMVDVETDSGGLIPSALRSRLENLEKEGGKMPKFLYTIPHSSNPSGTSLSNKRKKEIYEIASQYDFLILEDDPYFYLTEDKSEPLESFFSMDKEKRVLRFDSFSKVLSSGLRIGWVSGPTELIERINFHTQATLLHTCGISQTLALCLLNEWGFEGFDKHIIRVKELYFGKMNVFIQSCEKYLKEYATWVVPKGGMFLWIKLKDVKDSKKFIEDAAKTHKILMVPGEYFHPLSKPGPYVRASFSIATDENIKKGVEIFGRVLKEYREKLL